MSCDLEVTTESARFWGKNPAIYQERLFHRDNGPDASISTRTRINFFPFPCACAYACVRLHNASCDVCPVKKTRSTFHSHRRVVRENIELANLCESLRCACAFHMLRFLVDTNLLCLLLKTRLKHKLFCLRTIRQP